MARNPVQFQKGISLNEFLSLYGTEQQCFDALYHWRWPNGFVCPNCGHDRGCQLTTHKLQQCYRCNRQTSITAGTIFEATKLPQRRDADRACLARPRLLQVHPAHRRRSIPTGLEPFEQSRQVRLQVGLVLRRRHSVHTRCRVLADSPVGFAHPHLVDVVRQRRQGQLRLSPSQFRYLALSR